MKKRSKLYQNEQAKPKLRISGSCLIRILGGVNEIVQPSISKDEFIKCPSDDTVIWRYIKNEHISTILYEKKIYFSLLSKMKDEYEGMPTEKGAVDASNKTYYDGHSKDVQLGFNEIREAMYLNCWSVSETDERYMWEEFAGVNGIAIKSTVGRLKKAMRPTRIENNCIHVGEGRNLYVGKVEYATEMGDRLIQEFKESKDDYFWFVFRKRKMFEKEKELRIVFGDRKETIKQVGGIKLDVDLDELVLDIYVNPKSDKSFEEFIKNKYSLNRLPIRNACLKSRWG